MGSVLANLSPSELRKLHTRDGGKPAVGEWVDVNRYASTHPALDALKQRGALYLVTVQGGDVLWLVAVLGAPRRAAGGWRAQGNMCPVVDLTPLCAELGLERGDGKLAKRLKTPRVLDQRAEAILTHVEQRAREALDAGKPYRIDVPKKLLKMPAIPAPKAAPKPKPVAGGKLPPLAGSLGEACLAQIDENLDELRRNPRAFLVRARAGGAFVSNLKTIHASKLDAAEVTRILRDELFPFVNDATRAALEKPRGDIDVAYGRILDEVSIRAVDALCLGALGYALGVTRAIPEACKWYFDPLQKYAAYIQRSLRSTQKSAAKKSAAKKTAAKKEPQPSKGSFAFVNVRTLDGDDIVAETTIHQAQFIETMAMYSGDRKQTAAATLDAYRKREALFDRSDFRIELWDVIEGGREEPRFEYWVQGAGDGMLFEYGTDESPAFIGSTQHRFEAHGGDDDETNALVAALQAAADRTKGL